MTVVPMRSELIDDSLWFQHANGFRLFPWIRFSKHHGYSSFWVSDGSNHISDAIPVATVSELVLQVFTNGRSIWLCDGGSPSKCGLYRFGAQVIRRWGGSDSVSRLAVQAGAPRSAS